MFSFFNRLSVSTLNLIVASIVLAILLMVGGLVGDIGFMPMVIVLTSGTALGLTAGLAKQDTEDPDNWWIGLTAAALSQIFFLSAAYAPTLFASDWAWAVDITVLVGLWVLYSFYPNWWCWRLAWALGARICGIGGAILYGGLTAMGYLHEHDAGRFWEVLCFGITGLVTAGYVFGDLIRVEIWGKIGFGHVFALLVPGDCTPVHRGGVFKFLAANCDSAPRTELTPEQFHRVMEFRRARDFDGLEQYATDEGIDYDVRWDVDLYLMELPGYWFRPIFSMIVNWLTKFDVKHSGDVDHGAGGEHLEEEAEPNQAHVKWVQATLEPIADIDVEKRDVGTGLRSPSVSVMTGVAEMFIVRPRRFFRIGKAWRHHLDNARDALVAAICAKVGPRIVACSGRSVFDLLNGFEINVGTAFGDVQERFLGVLSIADDIDRFGHALEHLGLASAPVVFKWVVPAGEVESARAAMTKAAGEAEVAGALLNARLEAIDRMLKRAGFDEQGRQEAIRQNMAAIISGDLAAIRAMFGGTFGVVPTIGGGGRGNQGGGGGNTP